jgi:hypothetical protein
MGSGKNFAFQPQTSPQKKFRSLEGDKKIKKQSKTGNNHFKPSCLFFELGKATLEPAKRTAFSFWDKRWNENRPDLIMKRLYLNFFMGRSRG